MVIIRVHMRYLDRSTHQLPITGNAAKLAAPLGASADGGPELVHRFGAAVVQQGKTQRSAKGLAGAVAGALFKARVDVLRSEEHTSELQSRGHLVCRLL